MFENNNYKSPYSMYDPTYISKLEEENKRLKEQQRQMADPMYAQFQNSAEYQEAKKNNVLTFLFELVYPQWQASDLGKKFAEWDKKQYEIYKESRVSKSNPNVNNNPPPMQQPNIVPQNYSQPIGQI